MAIGRPTMPKSMMGVRNKRGKKPGKMPSGLMGGPAAAPALGDMAASPSPEVPAMGMKKGGYVKAKKRSSLGIHKRGHGCER